MATRPPILKAGDTIGVVTLGSPLDREKIDDRIAFLEGLGFNVILGDHVYDVNGYLAGTDEQRATDLMNMFYNPLVTAILPTRGGTGVQGILPYLDYEFIANNPKIITGYSDITILLNTLYQYSDIITFHSLLLIDFRPTTPSYNFDQFFAATSVIAPTRVIQNPEDMPTFSIIQGNVTGPLVGGNITSFVDSLGTPYEIDTAGKIIFLEETHEPINTVYRYVNHLKIAGKLDNCLGIIMGECTDCTEQYGKNYDDLINDFFVPLGKPLITNVATGHGRYKAALPVGAVVNLDTYNNRITVMEPTVALSEPQIQQPQTQVQPQAQRQPQFQSQGQVTPAMLGNYR